MKLLVAWLLAGITPTSLIGVQMAAPPSNERAAVLREACNPAESRVQAPRYPPEEVRREIQGTVRLLLVTNRCGQVRLAWIADTSGNRNLDNASINKALHWVIPPFAGRERGGYWSIRVTFDMPTDPFKGGGHSIHVDPSWVTLGPLEPAPPPG